MFFTQINRYRGDCSSYLEERFQPLIEKDFCPDCSRFQPKPAGSIAGYRDYLARLRPRLRASIVAIESRARKIGN